MDFFHLSCDFSFGTCLWANSGNASWRRFSDADGWWLEAAGNSSEAHEFVLETDFTFSTSEEKALFFSYQLNGSSSELVVESRANETAWQRHFESAGAQGGVWQQAFVKVPAGTVALRLSASTAAEDVVRIQSLQAVNVVPTWAEVACSFEAGTCGWSTTGANQWRRAYWASLDVAWGTGPYAPFEGEWCSYTEADDTFNQARGKNSM